MNKLKEYLEVNGTKANWMAANLGITPAHMSRIINGPTQPSLSLRKLIEVKTGGAVREEDWDNGS